MAYNYTMLVANKTTAGSIANWVNRSDLPTDAILFEAQAWLYQRLRVREMQEIATLTFTAGDDSAALPDGYLDPVSFTPHGWGDPMLFVSPESWRPFRDETGALETASPTQWSVVGETTAYVDVLPETDFAGKLIFYKQPAALAVTTNETNWLTRRYPSLLRYACMARAYEHMKDAQSAATYLQLAMASIAEAAITNDMARRGQTTLM